LDHQLHVISTMQGSHLLCQLGLIFQWVWHCHQLPTKEHIPSKVLMTIAAAYEAEIK
jgi:hypothetical protein